MFITIKEKDKIIKDLNENLGLFFNKLNYLTYINHGDIYEWNMWYRIFK